MGGLDTSALTVVAPLAVIAAVGVSLLLRTRKAVSARSMASGWAQTMGTVLSAGVQVTRTGTARLEHPLIFYAYQVNGQVFQGQRVRVGDGPGRICVAGSVSSAAQTVARYPAGASVVVYYDPDNPSASALER